MQSFELNKHGKIVFPANCFPDLDFSAFESIEQLDAVIRRDFDSKAPTGTEILDRIKTGSYQSKFELMRDMALNLACAWRTSPGTVGPGCGEPAPGWAQAPARSRRCAS